MNNTLFKLLVGIPTEEETPTVHMLRLDHNYCNGVRSELREWRTEVKQTAESRFFKYSVDMWKTRYIEKYRYPSKAKLYIIESVSDNILLCTWNLLSHASRMSEAWIQERLKMWPEKKGNVDRSRKRRVPEVATGYKPHPYSKNMKKLFPTNVYYLQGGR